jgi:8-oxo-dGTP diphosphatase
MERKFCGACAGPLESRRIDDHERLVCTRCGEVHYQNPLPVASVLVPGPGPVRSLLVVKRKFEPHRGSWCLPIGFAELSENIEQAALRELKEEAGIDARITGLLDASSYMSPMYGDVLIVTFEAAKVGGTERPGDDALEARYAPLDDLPDLPFEPQRRAVAAYIRLHHDEWIIKGSMDAFLAGTRRGNVFASGMASDLLLDVLKDDAERAVREWVADIMTHASTRHYHTWDSEELAERGRFVLERFADWLKGTLPADSLHSHFVELGANRRAEGYQLHEVISSFLLLKKHLWALFVERGYQGRVLDTYRILELDKRVAFFFDYAVYHAALGFESAARG